MNKVNRKGEKEFEAFIVDALPEILDRLNVKAEKVERQKRYGTLKKGSMHCIIDILVTTTTGELLIFEIKNNCPTVEYCKAIGQLYLYSSLLRSVIGANPILFLVGNNIKPQVHKVIENFNVPINVIDINNSEVRMSGDYVKMNFRIAV